MGREGGELLVTGDQSLQFTHWSRKPDYVILAVNGLCVLQQHAGVMEQEWTRSWARCGRALL